MSAELRLRNAETLPGTWMRNHSSFKWGHFESEMGITDSVLGQWPCPALTSMFCPLGEGV